MAEASPLNEPKAVTFKYRFRFGTGEERAVTVTLDGRTLNVILPPRASHAPWAGLGFCQCPSCPLRNTEQPTCPAATSLEDILPLFAGHQPDEIVDASIETAARTYLKRTSLQQGVASLLGIYMVGSGCPILGKLKPMVRFHLPFATLEETQYRALSMYLLAQYLVARRGQTPDWKLQHLVQLYRDIQDVNEHFLTRLSAINQNDPSINALVMLEAFSYAIAFSVDRQMLEEIEILFRAYFDR